ncbi:unnamed protein product [Chrysoparadoxa australica]
MAYLTLFGVLSFFWTTSGLQHPPSAPNLQQAKPQAFSCRRGFCSGLLGLAILPQVSGAAEVPESWPDLDGAIGWNWGGKDRCLPEDEACLDNGQTAEDGAKEFAAAPALPDGVTITDKVFMDISLGDKELGRITLGLYGGEAPTAAEQFKALCEGSFFIPSPSGFGKAGPFGYEGLAVDRVEPGKLVRFAKIRLPASVGRRDQRDFEFLPPTNEDISSLPHGVPGLLSVKRGGGDWAFSLTTGSKKDVPFDRLNQVVGQVIEVRPEQSCSASSYHA